jgi:hypothetical protein
MKNIILPSVHRRCQVMTTGTGHESLNARYVLQRRSGEPLITGDAVEPDHRSGNVADSFLAFCGQQEAEAFREAMRADQFEVVELPPDVWLDTCRGFLEAGLTYLSLPEPDGDTVVKKAVRLADILAALDQAVDENRHLGAYRWNRINPLNNRRKLEYNEIIRTRAPAASIK